MPKLISVSAASSSGLVKLSRQSHSQGKRPCFDLITGIARFDYPIARRYGSITDFSVNSSI